MKIDKKIIVLITILVGFTYTYSQGHGSLEQYMLDAVQNNPLVKQKFAEFNAALQRVPQAASLPDPEFSAGFFIKPMELESGSQLADLRLMQMFPWFGTLKYAKDEMSLMAKAKYEEFRDAKFKVMFDVQKSWYELHKVQKNIEISVKNLEILNTLENLALIKFKTASVSGVSNSVSKKSPSAMANANVSSGGMSGMSGNTNLSGLGVTKSINTGMSNASMQSNSSGLADLYRIQIQISDLENEIELLKNQKTTLTAQFNSTLNRDMLEVVTLPETLVKQELKISVNQVLDTILTKNSMLEMLRFEQKSLEAKKEMVIRMGYPMLGLGLNYAVNKKNPMSTSAMNGEDMIMPMVSVTIPIYRKKYHAMKLEVDNLKESTEYRGQALKNNLRTEYYENLQNYQDANRRIDLFSKQVTLSNQTLSILIKSYSAGANLTDLLIIQQQNLDYELKQVQALADYNTAIAYFNRMMAFSQINN